MATLDPKMSPEALDARLASGIGCAVENLGDRLYGDDPYIEVETFYKQMMLLSGWIRLDIFSPDATPKVMMQPVSKSKWTKAIRNVRAMNVFRNFKLAG